MEVLQKGRLTSAATTPPDDRAPRHPARPFVLLVLLQVGLLSFLTHGGWFFVDDFLFLAQGREERFSLAFLRLPLFEHFSPMHRVFDFALIRIFGLDWMAAHVVLLVLAASCIGAFALLAQSLFTRPWATGLTAAYGTSLAFVRNIGWWTGGVHLFLLTAFSLLTIVGYVRWYEEQNNRWIAFSYLAYCLALLSHEQAMLVPAYLLLLRAFVLLPRRYRPFHPEWRLWLGYAALTALSLANFLAGYSHSHAVPSPVLLAKFLAVSLFEGLLPSLFAIKVPEAPFVSIPVSVVLGAFVATAVVAASLRRSSRAWYAWMFFAVSFVIAVMPLGVSRIGIDGVDVGRELHYLTAPGFIVLIALGAAFDPRFTPARFSARRTSRRLLLRVAPALVAVYLGLFLRNGARLQNSQWERNGPETYFKTFRRDLALVRGRGIDPVIVLPGQVPEAVVPAWLAPFNNYQHALALADPALRFDGVGPRFVVDPKGHLLVGGPSANPEGGR